ncbi:MAG TPA: hypothetical protein VGL61_24990 [Kofleriaceae bacterium]|jgi:hypothetical protein
MTQPCSLCLTGEASDQFHVCQDCADKLGLRPLPPSTRPAVPCTRCNATRFVRVVPREYSSDVDQGLGSDVVTKHRIAAPMTLTAHPVAEERWIRKGRTVAEPRITGGIGTLETFVCTGCGFVEWYCQSPQAIPVGHEYNSELVDVGAPPYR